MTTSGVPKPQGVGNPLQAPGQVAAAFSGSAPVSQAAGQIGGVESSSSSNLPLNVPIPNQMSFGGGTSGAPSMLPTMNTGGTATGTGISSASSMPGAPPPYDTHSFSGAMTVGGRNTGTAAVGGVNQPASSMFGGGGVAGGVSIADSMPSSQQNASNAAAKSTPNLEAAR